MNKKKLIICLSLAAVVASITAVATNTSIRSHFAEADDTCIHVGYHYEGKAATATESGWKEFWACCNCQEQFLEEPEEGTWVTQSASLMRGEVDASHIAYIPPLNEQQINYYVDEYELNVGDKATLQLDETAERLALMGTLNYSLNNDNISITDNGIITANKLGDTTITVTSSRSVYSASIDVSVTNSARDDGFTVDANEDIYEYANTVTNAYELDTALGDAVLHKAMYVKFDINITDPIVLLDFAEYYNMRNLTLGFYTYTRAFSWDEICDGTADSLEYSSISGTGEIVVSFVYSNWYDGVALASETAPVNGHEVTELVNAEAAIRRYRISQSDNRRGDDFLDFPYLNKNTKGYIDVENSETLWWALLRGYIPRFPNKHTNAEEIFERAKDVLRKEITDDMTDEQKILAIYDWISDNLRYDHEALTFTESEDHPWWNNTAWYLEGPFFHGRNVCDSFSRLFNLLCAIEGLTVERGCGFTSSGGHAWNYANVDDDWYLVCSTWAHMHLKTSTYESSVLSSYTTAITTPYFEITSYDTFLADVMYMEDEAGYSRDITDFIHDNHVTKSKSAFDVMWLYGESYDFNLDGEEELTAILTACYEVGLTEFYLPVLDNIECIYTYFYDSLDASGYKSLIDAYGFNISGGTYWVFNLEL